MKVLYSPASDGATLTASTANTNFPVNNVISVYTSEYWRSTAATSQYIGLDFGTATPVSAIGIISNLTSSATITIYGSATGAFGGEEVLVHTVTAVSVPTIFETFTSVSYRYYRVNMSDATLSYIQVGRLALGAYWDAPDIRPNPKLGYDESTITDLSIGGQSYGVAGYQFREYDVSFPKVTQAEKENFRAFFAAVKNYIPFFVNIWDCAAYTLDTPVYAKIDQRGFIFSWNSANIYSTGLKLREVF